jgi:histone-lysine N-methyltransferase SETD3
VFDSYGSKCNSRYFLNYGFALPDNATNEYALEIAVPAEVVQYKAKVAFLGTPYPKLVHISAMFGRGKE